MTKMVTIFMVALIGPVLVVIARQEPSQEVAKLAAQLKASVGATEGIGFGGYGAGVLELAAPTSAVPGVPSPSPSAPARRGSTLLKVVGGVVTLLLRAKEKYLPLGAE